MPRRVDTAATLLLPVVGLSLLAVAACGPITHTRVDYSIVDADFLKKTSIVVAASRADTTPGKMTGSTLFVDRSGKVRRAVNEGMDDVTLAYADDVVGFSDIHHDYLLGSRTPVISRAKVREINYGSYLRDGHLISLFNGGVTGDTYNLTVADTEIAPKVITRTGWASSQAQCDDGIWVARPPGKQMPDVSAPTSLIDRISPIGAPTWTVHVPYGAVEILDAACEGETLVALANSEVTVIESKWRVVSVDVTSGASTAVGLTGVADYGDIDHFDASAVVQHQLYTVATVVRDGLDLYLLLRIDPDTGHATVVSAIDEKKSSQETQFRIQNGTLYVLDATRKVPSSVRAFSLVDGRQLGKLTFDPLENKLNRSFTPFDSRQFIEDFVVLQPVDQW